MKFSHRHTLLLLLPLIVPTFTLDPICGLCHETVGLLHTIVTSSKTAEVLQPIALWACTLAKPEHYCNSKINRALSLMHELGPLFNSSTTCSRLHFCSHPSIKLDSEAVFTSRLLRDRPPTYHRSAINSSSSLKVLVFADPHIDLDYTENKSSVCNHSLCCRKNSPDTNITAHKAGRYGHRSCDLPNITVESFVDEALKREPDIILWLGDNVAHNMDEQRKETQLDSFKYLVGLLKGKYKGGVYAVLGNHDGYPEAQFDIHNGNHKWLIEAYSEELKEWLTPEATKQMAETGYFSQVHPGTNLKVIALNTFVLDFNNAYLWGNATNPLNSLAWLENELAKSEARGESVFIIGHIASQSNSGVNSWTYRYSILVERYAHIIKGQFYGHIHADFFFVMRSQLDNSPISVTHLLPALTPSPNPSFRIYDVDPATYELLDYTQYRLYLDEANKLLKAEWKVAYEFLKYFEVDDMSPQSFEKIIDRMENEKEYFKKAYLMYHSEERRTVPEGNAKQKFLCSYKTWNMYEQRKCLINYMDPSDYIGYYFPNEKIIANWSYVIEEYNDQKLIGFYFGISK
eukprot:TRINITY_DN2227_c0_g1_i1.p1 TRINITY_DN2227_c0_g1~~TRINITY_DN2227_c0_g1_i1.p1  ORF type:complete len:592 (-),score=27.80 TRINITY_DN2227_c0_g1_i1:44-1762(-)